MGKEKIKSKQKASKKKLKDEFENYKVNYNEKILKELNEELKNKKDEIKKIKENYEGKIDTLKQHIEGYNKTIENINLEHSQILKKNSEEYEKIINDSNETINLLKKELDKKIQIKNDYIKNSQQEEYKAINIKYSKLESEFQKTIAELDDYKQTNILLNKDLTKYKLVIENLKGDTINKEKLIEKLNKGIEMNEEANKNYIINLRIKENSIISWKEYAKQLQGQLQKMTQITTDNISDGSTENM